MMNIFMFPAGVARKKVTQIQRSVIPGDSYPEVVSFFWKYSIRWIPLVPAEMVVRRGMFHSVLKVELS
jgi:hypothetical protein